MRSKTRILIGITLFFILIFAYTTVYAKTGKTTSETTRLRESASTDSNIVTLISVDSDVEILAEEGEWYQVKYNDGTESYTGYIRKDILSLQEDTTSQDNTTSEENQTTTNEVNTQDDTSSINEETNAVPNEEPQINENQNEENTNIEEQPISDNSEVNEEEKNVQIGYTTNITTKLDVKILPLISSSIISSIDENTQVKVTEVMNKWCYVEAENSAGWVLSSKLISAEDNTVQEPETVEENTTNTEQQNVQEEENKKEESKEEESKTQETEKQNKSQIAYVSVETLNIREKPETNAKIILQVATNTELTVIDKVNSEWSKVSIKGTTGYASSKYLSDTKVSVSTRSEKIDRKEEAQKKENEKTPAQTETTPAPTTSSSSSATGENVVAFAKQYLGSKYVSGGTSPSTGFDCSGFTTYVFKHFGISISRTSSAQASNGVAVSKANLQAGDILVFNNSSNTSIGHVGIYIGGNSFIHAANSKKGVIISSLSDSYYSPRYVTARRVIN